MINNYIRGGQIFLHKVRMFLQVWYKTVTLGILIGITLTITISISRFEEIDYKAVLSYSRAKLTRKFHDSLSIKKESRIPIQTKFGNINHHISIDRIISNRYFQNEFDKLKFLTMDCLKILIQIFLISISIIIIIWYKFGKLISQKNILNNSTILSDHQISKILRKEKMIGNIRISNMPLVKNSETSHIFISGTTGSGKTTLMYNILPQIRTQKKSAIVIDYNSVMSKKYFEEGDIIIGSDEYSWDIMKDIQDKDILELILNSLYPTKNANYDIMWNNTSKQFFRDALDLLSREKNPNIQKLYNFLAKDPLEEIHQKLQGTSSYNILNPANEKTSLSVRTNTISSLSWMENIPLNCNQISICDWIKETEYNQGSWIFLKASPKERTKLFQLFSLLIEIIINSIMELGENHERRIWMIIDELASLQYIPSLPTALSEFRKYGGCILASTQSGNQLSNIYGNNTALSMLDQFNTKFIFRSNEVNFNQYIIKSIGNVEYTEQSENYSYGSHEIRDGVNISKLEKQKPLILPSDISKLGDLECYVQLPCNKIRLGKIKIKNLKSLETI